MQKKKRHKKPLDLVTMSAKNKFPREELLGAQISARECACTCLCEPTCKCVCSVPVGKLAHSCPDSHPLGFQNLQETLYGNHGTHEDCCHMLRK